jgi:hypothetical protein
MKTRFSKELTKKLHKLFLGIKKNKLYLFMKDRHLSVKIFIWVFMILFGILWFIVPIIPFSIFFMFLWLAFIFEIKTIKRKFLYLINKTRIKHFLIIFYIKIFKRVKNK